MKVAIAVSDNTVNGVDVAAIAFQFILTFALWASYFEDLPHAGINPRRLAPWLAFHLVTQLGIAGTAIGACTRRRPIRPLLVLRVTTALVVALVGVAAWKISWVDRIEGVALLTVVAVVHAFAVAHLRAHTEVVPIGVLTES